MLQCSQPDRPSFYTALSSCLPLDCNAQVLAAVHTAWLPGSRVWNDPVNRLAVLKSKGMSTLSTQQILGVVYARWHAL